VTERLGHHEYHTITITNGMNKIQYRLKGLIPVIVHKEIISGQTSLLGHEAIPKLLTANFKPLKV